MLCLRRTIYNHTNPKNSKKQAQAIIDRLPGGTPSAAAGGPVWQRVANTREVSTPPLHYE
jgi:hypothetical protein